MFLFGYPAAIHRLAERPERVLAGLAAVSIGVAAHLAFFAVVPLMAVNPAWLVMNALACLGLAAVALRR